MKISIAMATYNGGKYLKAQLQSFLDQTRQPDELVITDDCSTDQTVDIVRAFAETAPFKVVFSRNDQNLGYCGNFNAALMQTTGDLVFLSDQDDVWYPEKIATITELAEKNTDKLVIMNDAALTDEALNDLGLTKLNQILSAGLSKKKFVMGCCCAVRRELLDLCLPIPDNFKAHDEWIVHFADGLGGKLIYDEVLQYYRRHGDNTSQAFVNRTTKITKFFNFKYQLASLVWPTSEADELMALFNKKLFLEGICRAKLRSTGNVADRLEIMRLECQEIIKMAKRRIDIRRKKIPGRILASLKYWQDGGYHRAEGIKSIIRDIRG